MDEADYAAEAQHAFVEAAIAAVVARAFSGADPGGRPSTICSSCGEPIPASRRRALPGCRHCIDCAQARELDARRHGLKHTGDAYAADC